MDYKETKGFVHSIETMGTLDGPGNRFVVFLQGCPLRCLYCHNPDTWKAGINNEMTAFEVVERAKRYQSYFGKEGGITLSGGEPLFQPEFTRDIFRLCKEAGIHTALDTAGSILNPKVEEALEYTDLILLDFKHTEKEKFSELTGGKLETTFTFLDRICKLNIDFWVREVIVPGYNDDEAQMYMLASFLQNRPNLKRVELLAFHNMGIEKWKELNLDYQLEDTTEPSIEELFALRKILKNAGLPVKFPNQ